MKHYKVVCAVVVHDREVLCMQRQWQGSPSSAGKWEFPGGKIEDGEIPEEALEESCMKKWITRLQLSTR